MTVLSRSKNAASTWPSLGRADVVTVTVRHLTRTDVPFVGILLPDVVPGATLEVVFDLPAPGPAGVDALPRTTGGF